MESVRSLVACEAGLAREETVFHGEHPTGLLFKHARQVHIEVHIWGGGISRGLKSQPLSNQFSLKSGFLKHSVIQSVIHRPRSFF